MANILSTHGFDKDEIEKILSRAEEMEGYCVSGKTPELLKGKIVACVFFEPSTRTRLSFETAALRLGARVISSENAAENSSAYKGETIEDTSRVLSCYADAIVMRHPDAGSVARAASVSTKLFLNAGDGAGEHPTQGFLDLYTIKKECGKLEGLNIALVGDLKNSRTLHSLLPLLEFYSGNKFHFVSPKELAFSDEFKRELTEKGISYTETESLEDVLPLADVVYMTRVQKERFANDADYEKVKDSFVFESAHLELLKKDAVIMHPLPRINEIEKEIDNDGRAAYFRQAQNGLYVRMALLAYAFGI